MTAMGLLAVGVLGHDLRHAQEGFFFDALGGGEQNLRGREVRRDLLHDGAQRLRGRDAEDDLGVGDGVGDGRG